MGIKEWFFTPKKHDKRHDNEGFDFSDIDRMNALQARQQKRDLKKAMEDLKAEKLKLEIEKIRDQIEDIREDRENRKGEVYESEESDPMDRLVEVVLSGMAQKNQQQTPQQPTQRTGKIDLTEAQINQVLDENISSIPSVQKLPDMVIKNLMREKFPMLSEATLSLAVGCIKKKVVVKHG